MNESVTILEAASTAVNVTMVTPRRNVSPGLWLDVIVTIPELSLTVGGFHVTAVVVTPLSVGCVISAGVPEMSGYSSSENQNVCKLNHAMNNVHNIQILHQNYKEAYQKSFNFLQ